MKTSTTLNLLCSLIASHLLAQEPQPANPPQSETPETSAAPSQLELEQTFIKTLTKATFNGRWCLVEDGKPSPPKDEKYTINGVSKLSEDLWLISARIQYGKVDVSVPIPVQVKWAGDTPVISITNLAIPGAGTYTARVLIYNNTYAGTWSGRSHGGLLNGAINHD